jgi:uncharacterized protein YcfJ
MTRISHRWPWLATAAMLACSSALANVTFYSREGFDGKAYTARSAVQNLSAYGLNDKASSAIVNGERWEVCESGGFRGHCVILRPGNYPSLAAMGLNNAVSSVRPVARSVRFDDGRYAPAPLVVQDFRRQSNERLYQAPVVSVRAVLGSPQERCWVEREQISRDRDGANVPGAIAGAVIGGILGHQVGRGTGAKDIATVGGAVAGAAIGSQVGNDRPVGTHSVQHCRTVPGSAAPAYWDVIYSFRGLQHHVQMTSPPGQSVTVNRHGEPRA